MTENILMIIMMVAMYDDNVDKKLGCTFSRFCLLKSFPTTNKYWSKKLKIMH